jgi:ankyrin repeat protein
MLNLFCLGMAPLHLASWAGKTEIARLLVDARACVNTCADSGDTPLHLACQHCNVGVVSYPLVKEKKRN